MHDLACLESLFFIYPNAAIVVVGQESDLQSLVVHQASVQRQGYCLILHGPQPTAEVHSIIYQLQRMFGGLYVPSNGVLLNSVSHVTRHLELPSTIPVFQEVLHIGAPVAGMTAVDLSRYIWKRSISDYRENSTFICAVDCVRFIPKGSSLVSLLLSSFRSGTHPDVAATGALRPLLSDIVVLPYWLSAEPKFTDHWEKSGNRPGFTDRSTDLHAPRPKRFRQDYWYTISHKLWLPLNWALPHERNIFTRSVIALVLDEFNLNLFSSPFQPIDATDNAGLSMDQLRIKTPLDQFRRLMTDEQRLMERYFMTEDLGMSGAIGSYRTFKHVRIVGAMTSESVVVMIRMDAPGSASSEVKCGLLADLNTWLNNVILDGPDSVVTIYITAAMANSSCSLADVSPHSATSRFVARIVNVSESVTVISHSAKRCDLLVRMAHSLLVIYPGIQSMVTCETPASTDIELIRLPDMDWYNVPDDFGLSRGKSFLISKVTTEYVLVLDDDFTASFDSCLECMIMRMRSRLHSAVLPIDILCVPILEDERSFGAFRGTISVSDVRFAIEPFVRSTTPDGCARVDICPMVFLGRTRRLKTFDWNPDLPVGEHELFFLRNQYHGIQVAVCSDSSFTHLRESPEHISGEYSQRRARQQELMNSVFSDIGIGRTYYFFSKYSHLSYEDFSSLMSKNINPYSVRDDSSESNELLQGPPFPCLVFLMYSQPPIQEKHGVIPPWESCKCLYLVPATPQKSNDVYQKVDIVVYEADDKKIFFIFETLRKFFFHFVFIVDEGTAPLSTPLIQQLGKLQDTKMKLLTGRGIVGLSRDFAWLLSSPDVLRYLRGPLNGISVQECIRQWSSVFEHSTLTVI